MWRHPTDVRLKVLAVERADASPYAKVEVGLGGESICIRWGVDEETYPHLKRAIQTRCFDTMPGLAYEYYLRPIWKDTESGSEGVLQCVLQDRSAPVWFRCSDYFRRNILWFHEGSVRSIADLAHLAWDINDPATDSKPGPVGWIARRWPFSLLANRR